MVDCIADVEHDFCAETSLKRSQQDFLLDGVVLSESGMQLIKSLEIEKEKRPLDGRKKNGRKKELSKKHLALLGPLVLPSKTADGEDESDVATSKCDEALSVTIYYLVLLLAPEILKVAFSGLFTQPVQ